MAIPAPVRLTRGQENPGGTFTAKDTANFTVVAGRPVYINVFGFWSAGGANLTPTVTCPETGQTLTRLGGYVDASVLQKKVWLLGFIPNASGTVHLHLVWSNAQSQWSHCVFERQGLETADGILGTVITDSLVVTDTGSNALTTSIQTQNVYSVGNGLMVFAAIGDNGAAPFTPIPNDGTMHQLSSEEGLAGHVCSLETWYADPGSHNTVGLTWTNPSPAGCSWGIFAIEFREASTPQNVVYPTEYSSFTSTGTGPTFTTAETMGDGSHPLTAGDVLYAIVQDERTAGGTYTPTIVNLGTLSVTWTKKAEVDYHTAATPLAHICIWEGVVGATPGSGQIQITFNSARNGVAYRIWYFKGVDSAAPTPQAKTLASDAVSSLSQAFDNAFGNARNGTLVAIAFSGNEASPNVIPGAGLIFPIPGAASGKLQQRSSAATTVAVFWAHGNVATPAGSWTPVHDAGLAAVEVKSQPAIVQGRVEVLAGSHMEATGTVIHLGRIEILAGAHVEVAAKRIIFGRIEILTGGQIAFTGVDIPPQHITIERASPAKASVPAVSDEFIEVRVELEQAGAIADPSALTVQFALMASGEPGAGDWVAGTWQSHPGTHPTTYTAAVTVGGVASGAQIQKAPGTYTAYCRVLGAPEAPVRVVQVVEVVA